MSTNSSAETEAPEATGGDGPLLDLTDAGVKKFIKQAKARGYVTMDELNKVLPSEEVTSEQIEDTLAMLSEMGVNVVESEETVAIRIVRELRDVIAETPGPEAYLIRVNPKVAAELIDPENGLAALDEAIASAKGNLSGRSDMEALERLKGERDALKRAIRTGTIWAGDGS